MELIVKSFDEAALLEIQGVTNGKLVNEAVAVTWEVWRLYYVAYKESVTPLLIPNFRSNGLQHSDPYPCHGSQSHPMGIQCGGLCHGLLQLRLCVLHVMALDVFSDLPQEHIMVSGFELCPPVESCNQVSCDYKNGRPILPGWYIWFWYP